MVAIGPYGLSITALFQAFLNSANRVIVDHFIIVYHSLFMRMFEYVNIPNVKVAESYTLFL